MTSRLLKGFVLITSDCDEQLLLSISFNQPVKIHSLRFISKDSGPRTFSTFVNQHAMSFDDTESLPAIDEIEIPRDMPLVGLKFVKYQFVHSLTIFVKDNQNDSDVTDIQQLILYGCPIESTKDLKYILLNF